MRDSYKRFFKHYKIESDEFINFGINETIFPTEDTFVDEWESLKYRLKNNERVFIRGYGRDAWGTFLFQEFFRIIIKNKNIVKDSTNNNEPTKLLQKITGYQKNGKSANISNYQVSHIFGRTKNPLMFTAPWNIVWSPKVFDPFTGHESKGEITERYKIALNKYAKQKYHPFIKDYNDFIDKYFNNKKINQTIKKVKIISDEKKINSSKFKLFKKLVHNELSPLELS